MQGTVPYVVGPSSTVLAKSLACPQALEALRKLRTEKTQEVKEMRLKLEHLKTNKDMAQVRAQRPVLTLVGPSQLGLQRDFGSASGTLGLHLCCCMVWHGARCNPTRWPGVQHSSPHMLLPRPHPAAAEAARRGRGRQRALWQAGGAGGAAGGGDCGAHAPGKRWLPGRTGGG